MEERNYSDITPYLPTFLPEPLVLVIWNVYLFGLELRWALLRLDMSAYLLFGGLCLFCFT